MQNVDEFSLNPLLSGEWWAILGVYQDTHPTEVKIAYYRLARQYHPDINRSASAKASMQAINRAYREFLEQLNQ